MEPITISYSELDAFRQCPFKHRLAYVERWSMPVADDSALGKGTHWHSLLEAHYKVIQQHQRESGGKRHRTLPDDELLTLCAAAVKRVLDDLQDSGVNPDTLSLLWWMYWGYAEQWGTDPDWWIVAVEHTAIVPLYEKDGSESHIHLKVKIDLIIEDRRGRRWFIDHKSGKDLPLSKDLDFDDQFGLYTYAMRRLGFRVTGCIHNATRTQRNKGDIFKPGDEGYKTTMKAQTLNERMSRTYMNRTDAELSSIQADALADAKLAYSPHNPGRRHANPDTCKWRCPYKEECIFGRRTGKDENVRLMLMDKGWTQEHVRH